MKSISDLKAEADGLRADLAEFEKLGQPAPAAQPDAPGGSEGLSDAARETARELYGQSVMNTPAGQLNQAQRDFARQSIASVLHEMEQ
jgi:hypothetical protein